MIVEYYNSSEEEKRLQKDNVHKIEYLTTLHALKKYLPEKCRVLDCCAGAGVYAFPLAEAGFRVTVGDLIEKHIHIINRSEKRGLLEEVYQGNVLDLSRFPDDSFDAVLNLGSLYHLQTKQERKKAVSECLRVLKPNGIFAFSYINRNACFINHFKQEPTQVEATLKLLDDDGGNGLFYAMDFGETKELMSRFEVEPIADIGTDGLIYVLYNEINSLNEEQFAAYMKYQLRTCEQSSIIAHSIHGLWIGRNK